MSRASRGTGAIYAGLIGLALFLPGAPPKARDSAIAIAAPLADKRPEVLAGTYIAGFALVAWLVFMGVVREWLVDTPGAATTAVAAGVFGVALQLLGMLLFYGASFKVAGAHQDALVRGLTDAGNATIEMSKFAFAAFIAAICHAGAQRLPAWLVRLGAVAAATLVLTAIPLVTEAGVLQFGGGVDLAGALPGVVWIVAFSVLLVRREW
jgi:hypothetical protein